MLLRIFYNILRKEFCYRNLSNGNQKFKQKIKGKESNSVIKKKTGEKLQFKKIKFTLSNTKDFAASSTCDRVK